MGKQNQQRRAAKKRRQQRQQPPRVNRLSQPGRAPSNDGHRVEGPSLDVLLSAAVQAMLLGDAAGAVLVERLAVHGQDAVGAGMQRLRSREAALQEQGWSADDLDHVVRRKQSAAHAALVRGVPLPAGTVVDGLQLLVEALAFLQRLRPVARAAARPAGRGEGEGLDPKILARVRALLNKAESTTFAQEAEALSAKAQDLIARHAIDALLLQRPEELGMPSSRRIYLDDPYLSAKSSLLHRVADANRCSAVHAASLGWSTVFGFDVDLDTVEILTASLLAQSAHALAQQGSRVDAAGRSRTRSFRHSFLLGYAQRVGERLRASTDAQVAATSSSALVPVLAAVDQRVQSALAAAFPQLRSSRSTVSNGAGWAAGHAAADAADLGRASGVIGG